MRAALNRPVARGRRGGLATIACLGVAVLASGCADGPDVRADAAPAGWTTFHDVDRGFTVQFPSDWRRARRSLTPYLSAPRELVSLGTGPLRTSGPQDCAQMPQGALKAMSSRDVLVSIQEWGTDGNDDHGLRPASLRLDRSNRTEQLQCTDPRRQDVWWLTFGDRGRRFYALIALGREAPPARRLQAQRILRSLRIAPNADREAG